MSLTRFRRSSAPLALVTLVVFFASLVPPRRAEADDTGPPGPTGGGGPSSLATSAPPGVSGQALASVDLSRGTAQAGYPFALPTARGGAQPSLGLRYDSSNGVGFAGLGWSLDLPSIERVGASGLPRYRDDEAGTSPIADRFTYAGQPLVPICVVGATTCLMPRGESIPSRFIGWTYYRTELDDGMRFFLKGSTWVVQTKGGVEMQFGQALDSFLPGSYAAEVSPSLTLATPATSNTVYR